MIYITGCAKSGTTLLCRLFHAFAGLNVTHDELTWHEAIKFSFTQPYDTVVKRSKMAPFTFDIYETELMTIFHNLSNVGFKIINIVRDGRDVVLSDDGVISGTRWIHACRQAIEYRKYIDCQIKYEDLVSDPNTVQEYVAKKLDLTIQHTWSSYPKFVPEDVFKHSGFKGRKIYEPKPISTASVGKDLQAYKTKCRHVLTAFEDMLAAWGYI